MDFLNSPLGGAIAALVLSAAVRALPQPSPNPNPFYQWFYSFTHLVLANYDKLAKHAPEVKNASD